MEKKKTRTMEKMAMRRTVAKMTMEMMTMETMTMETMTMTMKRTRRRWAWTKRTMTSVNATVVQSFLDGLG